MCCVFAVLVPPWEWEEKDDWTSSPWWTVLYPLRIGPFRPDEMRDFLSRVGVLEEEAVTALHGATGGHPMLLACAASALAEGRSLSEALREADEGDGHFEGVSEAIVSSALGFPGVSREILGKAASGTALGDKTAAVSLWRAGLTRNASDDPPMALGSALLNAMSRGSE
jgi:hypothetical protein